MRTSAPAASQSYDYGEEPFASLVATYPGAVAYPGGRRTLMAGRSPGSSER